MAKTKLGETNLNVPITPDYKERLEARAIAHDREMSREAARIVKDVLDGRYVRILTSDGLEISGTAIDGVLPQRPAAETAGADATPAPAEAEITGSHSGVSDVRLSPCRAAQKPGNALAARKDGRSNDLKGTAENENLGE